MVYRRTSEAINRFSAPLPPLEAKETSRPEERRQRVSAHSSLSRRESEHTLSPLGVHPREWRGGVAQSKSFSFQPEGLGVRCLPEREAGIAQDEPQHAPGNDAPRSLEAEEGLDIEEGTS